jgi:protoporphyrinogen oxidase
MSASSPDGPRASGSGAGNAARNGAGGLAGAGGERIAGPGRVLVVGAGPAGLTAAYAIGKRGATCLVVEADSVPGGIARTVERDGWRFDIGGHRFFTKVSRVEELWHEILGPEDFLLRPRLSRIYYDGKFFDYPIQVGNALRGLGVKESILCGLSYLWARIHKPKEQDNFEAWTAARFGWRLYRMFFKTYTEKVWGMPANEIQADWAAQRIKNLSLMNAVLHAVLPKRNQKKITSLIEEFQYPRLGPGMMWEKAAELVRRQGSEVRFETYVRRIRRDAEGAVAVELESASRGGAESAPAEEVPVDAVVSSMPLSELVLTLDPPAPEEVLQAAKGLHYRDFLTIALVVPAERGFPDNWIYVHDPKVQLGRIQNFGSWSPEMVKDGRTCLGLEYFVFENDELWRMDDEDLVALGRRELAAIGLVEPSDVELGFVVRMPKAYPVYDPGYEERVDVIRRFLEAELPNVHPVGRNGMHRYNNQDHSMLTALLTVDNLFGANFDTWTVNVEAEYHEQVREKGDGVPSSGGTGRAAPVTTRSR